MLLYESVCSMAESGGGDGGCQLPIEGFSFEPLAVVFLQITRGDVIGRCVGR